MTRTAKCPHCGGLTVPPRETAVDIRVAAIRALAQDLSGCHDDAWKFFTSLFDCNEPYRSATKWSEVRGERLHVLLNRFYRAGVPSPKLYVAYARIIRVAESFADATLSIADIARIHRYSSAQAFTQHVRAYFAVTASELRHDETPHTLLARFRRTLVVPYREQWLAFHPFERARARRVKVAA